jgi:hypothetical protein
MRNFKELKIWQKGMDIAVNCYKIIAGFPKEEKFGLSLKLLGRESLYHQMLLKAAAEKAKRIIQDL